MHVYLKSNPKWEMTKPLWALLPLLFGHLHGRRVPIITPITGSHLANGLSWVEAKEQFGLGSNGSALPL